jgi:hypothetical protein
MVYQVLDQRRVQAFRTEGGKIEKFELSRVCKAIFTRFLVLFICIIILNVHVLSVRLRERFFLVLKATSHLFYIFLTFIPHSAE